MGFSNFVERNLHLRECPFCPLRLTVLNTTKLHRFPPLSNSQWRKFSEWITHHSAHFSNGGRTTRSISISGKSEIIINQNMGPRWPSMRGIIEVTSASTATIQIVSCSWKNKTPIILIRPHHTLILGWCNHKWWVHMALPCPKFSNCNHSLFTACRNLFHY